jgi:hypothetical protein
VIFAVALINNETSQALEKEATSNFISDQQASIISALAELK